MLGVCEIVCMSASLYGAEKLSTPSIKQTVMSASIKHTARTDSAHNSRTCHTTTTNHLTILKRYNVYR